jgi:hypothetical protein
VTTNYYVATDYWVDGYSVDIVTEPTVQPPTTVQNLVGSYLYWQYNDDSDLQAFVDSYNTICQQILNTFNLINLPVYAGNTLIVGPLLDWVAEGIYGCKRPILSSGTLKAEGTYDSLPYDTVALNYLKSFGTITQIVTGDDVFKRILTWNLYKGDGRIFNVRWLKRRVMRFLTGINGTDPGINQTYQVSVSFTGAHGVTIDLTRFVTANPSSELPATLQAAVLSGAVQLPFQFAFTVNI